MTIRPETLRYIFCLSAFILLLQVTVATGQSKKNGVTVSYEQSGTSRIARFATRIHIPSGWNSHIRAQDPVVQGKHLVKMRFL
jgi:hypothetical protein